MFNKLKQRLDAIFASQQRMHEPDRTLIFTVGFIVLFGLILLFSASGVIAFYKYQNAYYFFNKQIVWLIFGLAGWWFFFRYDYKRLRKYSLLALFISLGLLVLTLLPGIGKVVNGSRSWINLGFMSFQPAEFVKLTLLIYWAALLESKEKRTQEEKAKKYLPFFVILSVITILMMLQPDLGTLIIIMMTSLTVFFVFGGRIKELLVVGMIIVFCLAGYIGVKNLIASNAGNGKSYLSGRFSCLINPTSDAQGSCYQTQQSLIAIGSGGLFGLGLGNSQQKFLYLPEVQNDFIYAIIAEETGFIFSGLLIVLFFLLFFRGYLIAKNTEDHFGKNLAIGIVTWLSFQALLNIGGITNFLPMTGVPLPFVSAGGSALLASLSAVGILVNISKQTK